MKEPKFTKGPWRIEEGVYYACIRTDAGVIADMLIVGNAVLNRDNTNLIAAAPELFEALKASTHQLHPKIDGEDCLCGQCEFVKLRDAALAKALGEDDAG